MTKIQRETANKPPSAGLTQVDRPVPAGVNAAGFGSDVAAEALRSTGIPYIALELVDGSPITEHARERALDLRQRLLLFIQVCRAVEAAHRALIVHRDLKPSNVFLAPHGVKLLDFGLARPLPRDLGRQIETGTELTLPGLIVGTPRYMAPEQVTGQEVDARTDLFSAALILYEAAAGRPAFQGQTVVQVLMATLHGDAVAQRRAQMPCLSHAVLWKNA